jgi:hypothetical protein
MDMDGLDPDALSESVSARKVKPDNATAMAKEARLNAKEKRMSEPPPPPPKPPPPVDKSAILDKLHAYKERFPHLTSRNKVTAKSTPDELADELHYVEKQLAGGGGGAGMHVLIAAMHGLETFTRDVSNPLGLNLDGLGRVTAENPEQFKDVVDELMIKYGTGVSVGPEMRLAMAIGTLVYTVHVSNGDGALARAMATMGKPVKP